MQLALLAPCFEHAELALLLPLHQQIERVEGVLHYRTPDTFHRLASAEPIQRLEHCASSIQECLLSVEVLRIALLLGQPLNEKLIREAAQAAANMNSQSGGGLRPFDNTPRLRVRMNNIRVTVE